MIIPAYNAGRTIGRALEPLLRDPAAALEVIVVDDGSTDGTPELVEALALKDDRIRLVRQPKNSGTFHARVAGILAAITPQVGFADADDWIDGAELLRLAGQARREEADILIFGAWRTDPEGRERVRVAFPRHAVHDGDVLGKFARLEFETGLMWNKIYRREIVEELVRRKVDRRLVLGEDYIANVLCFAAAQRVVVVRDMPYHYLEMPGSQTAESHGARGFVDLYENFADALEIFESDGPRILEAVAELYRNQLLLGYCRVRNSGDLAPYRSRLEEALRRIIRIRPEFVNDFFPRDAPEGNGVSAALQSVRGSLRFLLSALRRKFRL
ncbi:MAG: glycosyltransferase family 2 protein [Verrucomicrobiota bacterium]